MGELKFSPGTAVEITLDAEDSTDIWYPGTVIKETRDGSFVVKYRRPNEGGYLTVVVDSLHIRPSPPACINTTFQLLEKVDAFCNNGWSSGVVTKVLSEGRYIVYFKRTRKEKELRNTDLRLPMMQIHGKWVNSSQDAAMISKTQESKDINLGGNGKIISPPENSSVVKESKEVRNGQQERALPSGKASFDARSVSSMIIKGVSKNEPFHRTSKELKTESAPKELQPSFGSSETQMTPTEQLEDVRPNTSMEESENGNLTPSNSASPERKLEISEDSFDSPTNKETPLREIKRRGPGRPPRSVATNPRASVSGAATKQKSVTDSIQSYAQYTDNCTMLWHAGAAAKQKIVTDSIQSYAQKPIVISLPCYNNSQWNTLHTQSNSKLPINNATEAQEVKKQLPNAVTDGSNAKNVNRGNPDVKGLKHEGITPKRKRGRPFGSLSAAKRKVNETDGALTDLDSTQRRSTRERREVYKSAIDTLKPKGKKLKTTTEIVSSIQETEANLKENADGVITNSIREIVEPDSNEVSGNVSDEDMPLSAWFGEAHSLPNSKKLNPGGNESQSGKFDPKTDQISSDKCNKETTSGSGSGSDVDLVQSGSQNDDTATQKDEGKMMMQAIVNGLPFIKTSPVWKVIESMEIFKQIPQNPHFQPLYNAKDHCREGLAICSMVTFSRLAEDLLKFQLDDPINILEDSMETLSDLESQGFSVELIRNRLSALLSIKRKYDPSNSLAKEIAEEEKERAGIDQELDEIDKKMAELSKQRALFVLEREKKDSKIGGLQLRFDSVREALEEAHSEFKRLAIAPW